MEQLTRLPDWEKRLIALVNEKRRVPYAYGTNDCASFVQEAVLAMTGVTLLPGVEKPRGWIAAAKFMIANGWADVEQMATEVLEVEPFNDPLMSRKGDVVSFERIGERHLAVRVGSSAVSPLERGLAVIDQRHWCRAWKVG